MAIRGADEVTEEFCGVTQDHPFHIYEQDYTPWTLFGKETEHIRRRYKQCGGFLTIIVPREEPVRPTRLKVQCSRKEEHKSHTWVAPRDPMFFKSAYDPTRKIPKIDFDVFECKGIVSRSFKDDLEDILKHYRGFTYGSRDGNQKFDPYGPY